MIFKINAYKIGSQSAKALAQSLGTLRITPTFRRKSRHVIINWGKQSNTQVGFINGKDLNNPSAVNIACDKLKTFQALSTAGFTHLPLWCTTRYEADQLLYTSSHGGERESAIYCRTQLTGHSGSGIVIVDNSLELVDAPLYTVKTNHKYEFRVHVFKGNVIDVQQKKKRIGVTANPAIRNHSNGYVYARSDITVPDILLEASTKAVAILGLDFGAVDIGFNTTTGKVVLFEVNTAPGLVGTTLEKYTQAFKNYLEDL